MQPLFEARMTAEYGENSAKDLGKGRAKCRHLLIQKNILWEGFKRSQAKVTTRGGQRVKGSAWNTKGVNLDH